MDLVRPSRRPQLNPLHHRRRRGEWHGGQMNTEAMQLTRARCSPCVRRGSNCLPCALTHSVFMVTAAVIIPVLQMRKPRHANLSHVPPVTQLVLIRANSKGWQSVCLQRLTCSLRAAGSPTQVVPCQAGDRKNEEASREGGSGRDGLWGWILGISQRQAFHLSLFFKKKVRS